MTDGHGGHRKVSIPIKNDLMKEITLITLITKAPLPCIVLSTILSLLLGLVVVSSELLSVTPLRPAAAVTVASTAVAWRESEPLLWLLASGVSGSSAS